MKVVLDTKVVVSAIPFAKGHRLGCGRPGRAERGRREAVLQEWYRRRLQEMVGPLLAKWEPELVHFIERRHDNRFREWMDRLMPQWRLHREELNRAPLIHEDWAY